MTSHCDDDWINSTYITIKGKWVKWIYEGSDYVIAFLRSDPMQDQKLKHPQKWGSYLLASLRYYSSQFGLWIVIWINLYSLRRTWDAFILLLIRFESSCEAWQVSRKEKTKVTGFNSSPLYCSPLSCLFLPVNLSIFLTLNLPAFLTYFVSKKTLEIC